MHYYETVQCLNLVFLMSQSVQFRLVEDRLGLSARQRLQYQRAPYTDALIPPHKVLVEEAKAEPSLFELVEQWLERIPFLKTQSGFEFWPVYVAAVNRMYDEERERVIGEGRDQEATEASLVEVEAGRTSTMNLLIEEKHEELRSQGRKRMSFRATQAALLIYMYKDEPILQWPYQLLTVLCEVDEMMGNFRHRHAQMVLSHA